MSCDEGIMGVKNSVIVEQREQETVQQVDGLDHSGSGIIDLLLVLAANKKAIVGSALAGATVAVIVGLSLPNTFTATAIIMPPQQPQTAVSTIVGQLGPLAAVAGRDLGLKTPSDLYMGLLGSRTIADHLIERFELRTLYKAKTMMEARAKFRDHTRSSSGKDSLIRIEVDDTDPKRAADIANAYVLELNQQNTAFGTTEAKDRRVFLEKQLAAEKVALGDAEEAMKRTQTKTGIIQVESQTSVVIASIAQLNAQITAGEVALQRLKMGATAENPEVLAHQAELSALRGQLNNLERRPQRGGDTLMSTSAIPTAGMTYLRGLRDLKYHEFLFEMLSKQYEAARIDENKVAAALQTVDIAVPPDQKSGPHRGLIILFGAVAGLTIASITVYLLHGASDPITRAKLQTLRASLAIANQRNGLPALPRAESR
jgi:tyrosine-protein kinase Etk/Wzc